mmetsp:Transcript_8373/g.20564  ORF Transcript_8373/g.20564 Transcript_8373/m.20564 type:complete len:311 (+) Transcript_8373:28-960(+)
MILLAKIIIMEPEIEISKSLNRQISRSHSRNSLVLPNEIPVYIQRSSLQFDDVIYFLTNVEPARFNFPKPPSLRLPDDTWAALQLRVDHVARNILDPHRTYAAAACVGILIAIVFYSIRPGYDRRRIHATVNDEDKNNLDDEIYDDYIQDDLWETNHSVDDVVVAELNYLNAELDKSMWIWRMGMIVSLMVLFGSVIFIAVLMERRNVTIDNHIRQAVEEIRPRVEDEGIAVEYRTRSSHPGMLFFLGKYLRPTRVVVFSYLDSASPRSLENFKGKKTSPFFSEDYQRRYFLPSRSRDEFTEVSSTFSII